jgi:hypothetical protein
MFALSCGQPITNIQLPNPNVQNENEKLAWACTHVSELTIPRYIPESQVHCTMGKIKLQEMLSAVHFIIIFYLRNL